MLREAKLPYALLIGTKVTANGRVKANSSTPTGRKLTKIAAKNQVTLPVVALSRVNLHAGAMVTVEADGPGRVAIKAVDEDFDAFSGKLPGVWPTDALKELSDEWI